MKEVREIRFQKRLPDFGLSAKSRTIRNRLSAMGYRLGRAKGDSEWTVFKVWLGAPDQLILRETGLDPIVAWTKAPEDEIIARADLAHAGSSPF